MARVDAYLSLIDDPGRPALEPGHPADAALHALLVHLAFSDGVVEGDEFALLQRIRPDLDAGELLTWATEVAGQPWHPSELVAVAGSEEERWSVLRFAARMVCLDGDVAEAELGSLAAIAEALGLPTEATRTVVDEIVARGGAVSEQRVRDALRNMLWRRLVPSRGAVEAELAAVVPDNVEPVCTICVDDDEEVAGLYVEGLAAHFRDGPAFVSWDDIASYTRVPVPGAAFHLHTHGGATYSIDDHRLVEVGHLLDFIFGR